MISMTNLNLKPIYGFGWRQDNTTIDVPSPFDIRVHDSELTTDKSCYSKLVGQVTSASHIYEGKWVLLSIRTLEAPQNYNVRVYQTSPITPPHSLNDPDLKDAFATGFAELHEV